MTPRLQGKFFLWGLGPLFAMALCWSDTARAQTTGALPAYVIAEFGAPPPVPDGPLSKRLDDAIRTAFVDSLAQSRWGKAQKVAMAEITASNDPRIAWLISDMMRFASSGPVTAALGAGSADR